MERLRIADIDTSKEIPERSGTVFLKTFCRELSLKFMGFCDLCRRKFNCLFYLGPCE